MSNNDPSAPGRPGAMTHNIGARAAGLALNTPIEEVPKEALELGHTRAEAVRAHGIDDPDLLELARALGISLIHLTPLTGSDEAMAEEKELRTEWLRSEITRMSAPKVVASEKEASDIEEEAGWWANTPTPAKLAIVVLTVAALVLLMLLFASRH